MTIFGKDYKGQILCKPCWNGLHYIDGLHGKISNCDQGDCECYCRAQLEERLPRRKKIETQDLPLDDIIENIGPRS